MEIADWRKRIDEIDAQLAELLCERSRCVIEIGKIKRQQNLPVYDRLREKEILTTIVTNNRGPLEDEALKRLFERILDESRRVERLTQEGQTCREENSKDLKLPDRRRLRDPWAKFKE